MEKKGRIFYELSEDEYEELTDLLIKVQGCCNNNGLYLEEEFKRLFEITNIDLF